MKSKKDKPEPRRERNFRSDDNPNVYYRMGIDKDGNPLFAEDGTPDFMRVTQKRDGIFIVEQAQLSEVFEQVEA